MLYSAPGVCCSDWAAVRGRSNGAADFHSTPATSTPRCHEPCEGGFRPLGPPKNGKHCKTKELSADPIKITAPLDSQSSLDPKPGLKRDCKTGLVGSTAADARSFWLSRSFLLGYGRTKIAQMTALRRSAVEDGLQSDKSNARPAPSVAVNTSQDPRAQRSVTTAERPCTLKKTRSIWWSQWQVRLRRLEIRARQVRVSGRFRVGNASEMVGSICRAWKSCASNGKPTRWHAGSGLYRGKT